MTVIQLDSVQVAESAFTINDSSTRNAVANLKRLRNQPVKKAQIDATAYALFRSGYFADVRYRVDGNSLSIETEAFPTIARLNIDGNQLYSDSMLTRVSGFYRSPVNSVSRLQEVYDNILGFYRVNGYDLAQIKPVD